MIYLTSPYTAVDPQLSLWRYEQVLTYVQKQIAKDAVMFAPIIYSHPIALYFDLPFDRSFWKNFYAGMLLQADELHVLKLPAWGNSVGVIEDINLANKHIMPIYYIDWSPTT